MNEFSYTGILWRMAFAMPLGCFAAVVWWLVARGWLSLASGSSIAWTVLTVLGLVLGCGMSSAHIRQRLSGQASVDRVDAGR